MRVSNWRLLLGNPVAVISAVLLFAIVVAALAPTGWRRPV